MNDSENLNSCPYLVGQRVILDGKRVVTYCGKDNLEGAMIEDKYSGHYRYSVHESRIKPLPGGQL